MQVLLLAILGLGTGAIYSLMGLAVVAVNVGSGVLNFATGAIGMLGAYTFYDFFRGNAASGILAFALALAASAAVGTAIHLLVMRRLVHAPPASRIVVTLGFMTIMLQGVGLLTASHGAPELARSPLPTATVNLGSGLAVGEDRLILAGIAVMMTVLLAIAQRKTRIGLAARAVAENRLVTASMGWSPDLVGAVSWAVGSGVAAVGAILAASVGGLSTQSLTLLVVPALAAALVGRFQSYGWTLAGGMAIGIAETEVSRYVSSPGWATAAPLLLIVVVLVFRGQSLPARTEIAERRPSVGSGRLRLSVLIPLLAAGTLLTFSVPSTWLAAITTTGLFSLLILSVIVLTGYAGQLSLAQAAMSSMGAYFTALLAIKAGLPLLLAVICGVAACTPVALVIALPALRTRGPNLAVATLSLAIAIDSLVISNPDRVGPLSGQDLGSFKLFGINLSGITHPATFAFVVFIAVVLVGVTLANLRRGRAGRRILAVRSNERAAAALGISVAGVKLYAFWLATMIAGLAGALIEAQYGTGEFSNFQVFDNINAILYAVIGGVGWIAGSIIGALGVPGGVTARIVQSFVHNAGSWLVFLGALGAIAVILQSPNGVAPLMRQQALQLAGVARRGVAHLEEYRRRAAVRTAKRRVRELVTPGSGTLQRVPVRTLELRDVTVVYGVQTALSSVSLSMTSGEIVGLIGPNGAGKSTAIDVITGFEHARAGVVLLDGRPIGGMSVAKRARAGISRSFQNLELFDDMTVLENLRTAGDRAKLKHYISDLFWPRNERLMAATAAAITEFGLDDDLVRFPTELDYGKRRLVAIARALSSGPSLLLLDEPAAGLDGHERQELIRLLKRVATEWGIGVLLVEHDVQLVFAVCARVVVLDQGKVIASERASAVRQDPRVIAAYLGDSDVAPSDSELHSLIESDVQE